MIFDPLRYVHHIWRGQGDIGIKWSEPSNFIPLSVRIHFVGGSGTAALALALYDLSLNEAGETLDTVSALGTGADLNWRLAESEYSSWLIHPTECLSLAWTNPDATNMTWKCRVRGWIGSA